MRSHMEKKAITIRKTIMGFLTPPTRCKRNYFLYDLVDDSLSAPTNQRCRAPGLVLNFTEKLLHAYLQITNMLWPSGQRLCVYKVLMYSSFT